MYCLCARPLLRPSGQVRPLPHGLDELPTRCVARHPKGQPAPTFSHLQELGESVFRCQCRNLLNPAGRFAHSKMAAQSIYSSLEALSTPEATKLAWTRLGKTCEAEGAVLTKVRGGSYPRHATNGRLLTTGVHVWEYEFTSAAKANGNRTMYVGVAQEGLDVEKGGHSRSGRAWYLRTDNGTLYGSGVAEASDQTPVERCFVVGDRIGVTLNLGDGSLAFSRNGALLAGGFPAGRIAGPVVGAVELLTVGQSLTLLKAT